MSKTNCINCGAAKEVSDLQCPFCGTRYVDMTVLDPFTDKPIYIQFRKNGKIITAKAYVSNSKLMFEPTGYAMRAMDGTLKRMDTGTIVHGSIDYTLYESIH
jgi:hypothetical protein